MPEADLRIKNLVKNHCLAKSINDAGWYKFRKAMQRGLEGFPHERLHQEWLEYFGHRFGKATVAVNPAYTSQNCLNCGTTVKKSLSTRTHLCQCGCVLDRDHNTAINILNIALGTVGHTETRLIQSNTLGDFSSTGVGEILSQQVWS
ncbi:MAG: transposase [Okeania sp. SIO1H6]|nr:transposase [Okeania sp. SIO1H6]